MMQSTEKAISLYEDQPEFLDLSDYCRLCLQVPEESQLLDLQLIYDEEENLSYYDCFTICTQIDLRAGGVNAPHQLCKACGLELQVAYDFHKKVAESKSFLLQLCKSEQTEEDVIAANTSAKIDIVEDTEEIVDLLEDKEIIPQHIVHLHAEGEPIEMISDRDDVGQYEESIEYESIEEHIDMGDYKSADDVADEDTETVQIKIDDQEYVIQRVNIVSTNTEIDALDDPPVQASRHVSKRELHKTNSTSEEAHVDVNSETFDYESTDSENELANDGQNMESIAERDVHTISKSDDVAKMDVKTVVISRKGDVKPRRRYSGKFNCDYCQKVFKNRSRMLIHRRSHEPDRPKIECEECGRLYATKQAKEVHVRTFHNRIGLKCPICGKVYGLGKCLEVHMRYHTGDFPYVCDLCGQKYAQMCHLNTHKNVKHNSVRYSCEHPGCGKFFTSSASLRNHEYSHSAMPFECSYCKRGYPAKAKLKVHIRQKHGIEVSLEQMEEMRKFHVKRSKLNLVKISE